MLIVYGGYNDPMPADKMMKLFIIQAISSFVSRDYDSGLHYLNEVKLSYAQNMGSLNPTLKTLAKEIIQSLDMFAPGATAESLGVSNSDIGSENISEAQEEGQGGSVTSELQDLLARRRAKRAGKKK